MFRNRKVYIDGIINAQLQNNNGCADFSDIHLSEGDVLRICERLKDNQSIRSLDLSRCSLDMTTARPLIGLVQTNKNIVSIDYSSNPIGFEIELDVMAALEKNKKTMKIAEPSITIKKMKMD